MLNNIPSRRLFIVRHGRSEANEKGIIISSLENGEHAYGLTPIGVDAARSTGLQLKELLQPYNASDISIISSPFLRTLQTAQTIASVLGVDTIRTDIQLRERFFGSFEKQSDQHYQDVWNIDHTSISHTQFQNESVEMVLDRMLAALHDAMRSSAIVVLVSHGDPTDILLTKLRKEDLRFHMQKPVGTAELTEITTYL